MKRQKSVMKHQFSQVPKAEIQRSSFDRSHGIKTSFDGGKLIPILVDEVLPGDTFNVKLTAFARMATPIFPIMDNLYMDTFFFAVPYRLVWENWEKFNGAQDNPGDSTDYVIPTLQVGANGWNEATTGDYFGLPTKVGDLEFSALPFRAYNLIFNEWFRDQNLQDLRPQWKGDGDPAETPNSYTILRRGKRHDYFTSCLPFPQKGDPVVIPIADSAPVIGIGTSPTADWTSQYPAREAGGVDTTFTQAISTVAGDDILVEQDPNNLGYPNIYADLSNASTITINELREAFQIQRLLERDARGGTRYIEIIKAHFGVTSPDARLQRPEYLGGGSTPINISPIASTVPTTVTQETPQGTLAAVGTASINNHGFTKSFTEHCIIIGLVSVRADLTYQQGMNRMWNRRTRYDFYWPALSHLGEQAVLNKEIFATATGADDLVFGYQERYAEYRYKPSTITGFFRSNADVSLDSWHLSQDFATVPTLNNDFIQDNPPIDRVIAVPDEPHFIFDGYFSMRCARPMPLYGVPGLIDHF